jgi:S-adenosylmethionine-diacylgycerolhomoserine-N-methlytransferase
MIADTAQRMDRMYAWQRHVYDLTRKFYLLGRDRLIDELPVRPGDGVAEIGCGTGRNLVALARRHPAVRLYGLDASAQMLTTARRNLARAGLSPQVQLAQGLGEDLDPTAMFGRDQPFDAIVLSYVLSMIPSWPAALERTLDCLRPGGTVAIVDFGAQERLPPWFRDALGAWLALFEVRPRHELADYLCRQASRRGGRVTAVSLYHGYSTYLTYRAP